MLRHYHSNIFILVLLRILLLFSWISGFFSLSLIDGKVTRSKSIQRVAIIGAGISGLSLAHALENSPTCASSLYNQPQLGQEEGNSKTSETASCRYGIETHIFDARSTLGTGGAGIQLTGGMAVLRKINPHLQESVARASVQLKRIKSFTKPWFGSFNSNNDNHVTAWPLFEMDIEECIRNANGRTEQELIIEDQPMSYTIMRSTLQDILYQNLPEKCKARVRQGKKLIDLKADEAGIICLFEDGTSSGPFDLVVGCDGVRSTVKNFVETGKTSSMAGSSQSIYSGIKIQYAVQDTSNNLSSSSNLTTDGEVCQYFGDGVYGLSGIYGAGENCAPIKAAFLIFRDDNYNGPFPKDKTKQSVKENVDWRQDEESLKESMIRRVQQAGVPSAQIEPIISDSKVFFELGVYFHNPLTFNGWSREVKGSGGRLCVVCGDAAHAMPPFLGQGGNQAIQDAFVLATKIFEFNALESRIHSKQMGTNESFAMMVKDYENLRWNPTSSITAKSIFLGYLETGGKGLPSLFRDAFFFFAGNMGLAQKVFLDAATPKIYRE